MHDLADAHLISFAFFAAAHEGRLVTRGGAFCTICSPARAWNTETGREGGSGREKIAHQDEKLIALTTHTETWTVVLNLNLEFMVCLLAVEWVILQATENVSFFNNFCFRKSLSPPSFHHRLCGFEWQGTKYFSSKVWGIPVPAHFNTNYYHFVANIGMAQVYS